MSQLIVDGNEIIPDSIEVTATNTSIVPKDNLQVILNINQASSTAVVGFGTDLGMKMDFINKNSNSCTVIFEGKEGTESQTLESSKSLKLVWVGAYWIPYTYTDKIPPIYARETALITVTSKMDQLCFDNASTGGPYTLSDGPYMGYTLQITVAATAAANSRATISFKSAVNSGSTVQKNLTAGAHHLVWQETNGWTYYEFTGYYTDGTSFSFII